MSDRCKSNPSPFHPGHVLDRNALGRASIRVCFWCGKPESEWDGEPPAPANVIITREEYDRLTKDAARIDWMTRQSYVTIGGEVLRTDCTVCVLAPGKSNNMGDYLEHYGEWVGPIRAEGARAAIDAAMNATVIPETSLNEKGASKAPVNPANQQSNP